VIEVKALTKSYNGTTTLDNAHLCINGGDFVSVIGPSGSGKTTLLNIMAGLLTPTDGQVTVDGVSLYDLNQQQRSAFRRKNFGFIFQSFNLISYLTAAENIEVPLYLAGEKKKRQRYVATESLERVGLQDKANRFPSQLSIGEQQRVAVARALADGPRVIFADEPTGNLDGKAGRMIMQHMRELNELGVTILLVTHDLEMANLADRKINLIDGRLSL
jgi:putative ABC transport system ATP-binding protein